VVLKAEESALALSRNFESSVHQLEESVNATREEVKRAIRESQNNIQNIEVLNRTTAATAEEALKLSRQAVSKAEESDRATRQIAEEALRTSQESCNPGRRANAVYAGDSRKCRQDCQGSGETGREEPEGQ